MKKRYTGFILAILMVAMSVFTGCSLVTRNWDAYYNSIVATIVDKDNKVVDKITKRELITAYGSYGYYYEQYYGNTRKEAIEATLTQLENRKLTILQAEKQFRAENGGKDVLTDKEKSYLWAQTYKALEDNFFNYVDEITGEADQNNDESSTDDSSVTKEKYSRQGFLNLQDYTIERKVSVTDLMKGFEYDPDNKKDAQTKEGKLEIYRTLLNFVNSDEGTLFDRAFSDYSDALEQSEQGLKVDGTTTQDRFLREVERIYKINYENYITQKYSESFKSQDRLQVSDVTVDNVLQLYINKVLKSYTQYAIEGGEYENDMLEDMSKIYYFKTGEDDTKFYTVSHILFQFDDAQKKTYNNAKTDLENKKITPGAYNTIMESLYVKPTVRHDDDGDGVYTVVENDNEKRDYEKNMYTLFEYITTTINSIEDPVKKAEQFKEFVYMYNQDPGIMNAEYNYTMGLNASQAKDASDSEKITISGNREYKSYSKMVQEFTLAGAEMYNDGNREIGYIYPELVMTENGFHIMMYTGECENLFPVIINQFVNGQNPTLGRGAIETLYNDARLNVCNPYKTVFDVLYDELATDNFATFENMNTEFLRQDLTFIHYESLYGDLLAN